MTFRMDPCAKLYLLLLANLLLKTMAKESIVEKQFQYF